MQYKIPVQIENEDKIFLNLSIRQIIIIMIGFSIAYSLFKTLEKSLWWWVALFPTIIIAVITLVIAMFNHSEMTFMPFMLNLIRKWLNAWERVWFKWTESFSKIEVWYVAPENSLQDKIMRTVNKEINKDILNKL